MFLCNRKTAYEMRIGDWSADVCSSDLGYRWGSIPTARQRRQSDAAAVSREAVRFRLRTLFRVDRAVPGRRLLQMAGKLRRRRHDPRSEEHTSELQSLMRNSYAVFCSKKKNRNKRQNKVPSASLTDDKP